MLISKIKYRVFLTILALLIININFFSKNTYLKYSPSEDALFYAVNSVIIIGDKPSSIGLTFYIMNEGNFVSYKDAKKWVKENLPNIKSKIEWNTITSKLPLFIPKNPYQFYKKTGEWNSWMCFLEFEKTKKTFEHSLYKNWTEQEKKIVIDNWCNMSTEDVSKLLPNRTIPSINIFAVRKLKLHKDKEYVKKIKSENTSGKKNPMYGKVSSRLGTKSSEYTIKKMKLSLKGRIGLSGEKNPMYGKAANNRGIKTPSHIIEKQQQTRMDNYNKLSDNEKLNLKEKRSKIMIDRVKLMNKKPTLPEKITKKILESINIFFESEKCIDFYICDYVIGKNIIEVQGDYWHGNPIIYNESNLNKVQKQNIHRDKTKKSFLTNKGYKILYLWENDLIKNYSMCEKLVKEFLEKNI